MCSTFKESVLRMASASPFYAFFSTIKGRLRHFGRNIKNWKRGGDGLICVFLANIVYCSSRTAISQPLLPATARTGMDTQWSSESPTSHILGQSYPKNKGINKTWVGSLGVLFWQVYGQDGIPNQYWSLSTLLQGIRPWTRGLFKKPRKSPTVEIGEENKCCTSERLRYSC